MVLIGMVQASFGQVDDCGKFRNGKFEIIDPQYGNSIIERKGDEQVEYGSGSGLKLRFKVEWVGECVYTLQLKKVLKNPKGYVLPKEMILTVEIIEMKENSYVQRSTSNLYDKVVESELVRME